MTAARRRRAPRAGRTGGRPRGQDPGVRARLVDAAIAQFIRVGIQGASLRAIAEEAGVTPAMLHYYFGDKRQMTLAVVQERLLPAIEPLRAGIEAAAPDAAGLVRAFVEGVGDMVERHPWLPPLWIREVLCEGGALRDALFKGLIPKLPQRLARGFATAQAEGRMHPDLDPRLMVVSLVGLTLFPAAGAPIWRQLFTADDIGADVLRRHTLALLDHGMGAGRRDAGRRGGTTG